MSDQYFSGRVQSVVFSNETNAFYIVRMILDTEDDTLSLFSSGKTVAPVSVKGNVPGIRVAPGAWFGFEGKWTNHAKFGKQLDITRAPVLKGGWDPDTAHKMLVANGVGGGVMLAIQSHFGDDELLSALGDADRLEEVPGIAKFSAMHVVSRWESVQAHFKALDFLGGLGLPSGLIRDIWTHFGDDAEKVLVTNPWSLVEVDGISFRHADEVATKMGLVDQPKQVRGAVLYACKNGRGFGHLYLQTGSIFHAVRMMVSGTDSKIIATALAGLHKDGLLVIDKKTHFGHMKWVLEEFCKAFFEVDNVNMKFRPSFFPFTEPSLEVDIQCRRDKGEIRFGEGEDWLEILGCGMVHPNVLRACGIDPDVYQGFAWGMGIDRIAMLKYGINDLRQMFESDTRWINHYGFKPLDVPTLAGGLSS